MLRNEAGSCCRISPGAHVVNRENEGHNDSSCVSPTSIFGSTSISKFEYEHSEPSRIPPTAPNETMSSLEKLSHDRAVLRGLQHLRLPHERPGPLQTMTFETAAAVTVPAHPSRPEKACHHNSLHSSPKSPNDDRRHQRALTFVWRDQVWRCDVGISSMTGKS